MAQKSGVKLGQVFETHALEMLKGMVRSTQLLTILPRYGARRSAFTGHAHLAGDAAGRHDPTWCSAAGLGRVWRRWLKRKHHGRVAADTQPTCAVL